MIPDPCTSAGRVEVFHVAGKVAVEVGLEGLALLSVGGAAVARKRARISSDACAPPK